MDGFGKIYVLVIFFFFKVTNAVLSNGNFPPTNPLLPPNSGSGIVTNGNFPVSNQAPCGSTLEVRVGMTFIITSPGYPNAYDPFTTCRWNFYTRTSSPLNFNCQAFQMAPSNECSNGAFLAIDPGNKQYLWYCGNSGPNNVVSKSNYMSLFFWSSWQNPNNYLGFYCTVTTNFSPTPPGGGRCRCGQRQPRSRIIGGEEAGVHEFPWMALVKPERGFCGGSLINDRFVLTAAHCIDGNALPNGYLPKVVLGEHNLKVTGETSYNIEMTAKAVWPHEKYNKNQGISVKDYDIGLVELERPVSLTTTPNLAPACAPDPLKSYDNVPVVVTGWGFTRSDQVGGRSDVLMAANLETVPLSQCKDQYSPGIITNKMICAFATGKDACFDDSGGPLIAKEGDNWVIVGIVSFGPDVCAHASKSGVYTRVAEYIPWIVSKIGNARTCPP